MSEHFRNREDGQDLIRWFENQLKNNDAHFLDLNVYIDVIEDYLDEEKYKKALKTCNLGIAQYPYSAELLFNKAQTLSHLEQYWTEPLTYSLTIMIF